jgi:hypothetical protein
VEPKFLEIARNRESEKVKLIKGEEAVASVNDVG